MKMKCHSGIKQAQGYLSHMAMLWPMKTLYPDYLSPKQFSKMVKCLDDFACANMFFVEVVHLAGHPCCSYLCLCLLC